MAKFILEYIIYPVSIHDIVLTNHSRPEITVMGVFVEVFFLSDWNLKLSLKPPYQTLKIFQTLNLLFPVCNSNLNLQITVLVKQH